MVFEALGSAFGARKERKKFVKERQATQDQAIMRHKITQRERKRLLEDVRKSIQWSFGRQRGELRLAGKQARQQIHRGGQKMQSSMQQSMMDRGLYSTTVFDNARRGIHADTTSALTQLNTQLGALRGDLESRRGQAMTGFQQMRMQGRLEDLKQWYNIAIGGRTGEFPLYGMGGGMGSIQQQRPDQYWPAAVGGLLDTGLEFAAYGLGGGFDKAAEAGATAPPGAPYTALPAPPPGAGLPWYYPR